MIVIVGETHDDVLYFESVLANRREELVLNRYKASIGTIFSQDVLIIHELYTSVLASAILTNILAKYYVDLVFVVGKCLSSSKGVKNGDFAISRRIIDANVDLSLFNDVAVSQIPGFDRDFAIQNDIFEYLCNGLDKRQNIDYRRSTYLSCDNQSYDMIEVLEEKGSVFALGEETIVIDRNTAGVAVACALKHTPFIACKVIENKLDSRNNLETYSLVLDKYIDLGKAVVSTINEIGRSDILEGE